MGDRFCQCPFQTAFVWRYDVSWYRTDLDREAFDRLRVIDGPADGSWRKLSPDGTIRGAAKRIRDEGLTGRFEDVDVDSVRRRVAAVDPAEEADRITVFRPPGSDAPCVADGNHYAAAKTLFLLDGGEFTPQPAYLGVTDTEAGQNAA